MLGERQVVARRGPGAWERARGDAGQGQAGMLGGPGKILHEDVHSIWKLPKCPSTPESTKCGISLK